MIICIWLETWYFHEHKSQFLEKSYVLLILILIYLSMEGKKVYRDKKKEAMQIFFKGNEEQELK